MVYRIQGRKCGLCRVWFKSDCSFEQIHLEHSVDILEQYIFMSIPFILPWRNTQPIGSANCISQYRSILDQWTFRQRLLRDGRLKCWSSRRRLQRLLLCSDWDMYIKNHENVFCKSFGGSNSNQEPCCYYYSWDLHWATDLKGSLHFLKLSRSFRSIHPKWQLYKQQY
jgi:hypothetical protein